MRLGQAATGLDPAARTVSLGDEAIGYDALVIATGSVPRPLPGTEGLRGVHQLRTLEDSRAIRDALDAGARTVVIGGGFIGSEIASAARARGLDATVVEALPAPLVRAVGPQLGRVLGALHERHGTILRLGAAVEAVEGDGRVERVRLADGTVLDADLVVVGVGVRPATDWLAGSGIAVDDGVVCDEYLRSSAPEVFAAGDVARWHNPQFDRVMRIEHWTNAAEQGMRAGQNAAAPDRAEPYSSVPYVWSDWYGSRIQLVGLAEGDAEFVIGDRDAERFVAVFGDGDRLTGAVALDGQRWVMRFRRLIAERASVADAHRLARTLTAPSS